MEEYLRTFHLRDHLDLVLNVDPTTCTGDTNGGALTINGSNEIVCSADDGGAGGSTKWNAIGDADGTGSVDFAGFDQDIVSAEDGGDILTLTIS